MLKNLLFLAHAKRVAAGMAESLLLLAIRNPQFSDRGAIRARIDYDLGVLYQALGRRDLARKHLLDARTAAATQAATVLVGKIDVATSSL